MDSVRKRGIIQRGIIRLAAALFSALLLAAALFPACRVFADDAEADGVTAAEVSAAGVTAADAAERSAADGLAAPPARWHQTAAALFGWVFALLAAALVVLAVMRYIHLGRRRGHRQLTPAQKRRDVMPTLVLAAVLAVPMLLLFRRAGSVRRQIEAYNEAAAAQAAAMAEEARAEAEAQAAMALAAMTFAPEADESADPANWGVRWETMAYGEITSAFRRTEGIAFGDGEDYFALPGVATFRGGNYRDGGAYGVASISDNEITTVWTSRTGQLEALDGTWTGNGWTGQPLIVQWDDETRQVMNLYDEKKNKSDLVEVIYAALDGHVYFLDLSDGSYTRDPLDIGFVFKGAGAVDPRGYPLLYLGAGDYTSDSRPPRMFIVSLIDGSVLYEAGYADGFSLRSWCAYDSSPLVDAATDTLIWPGENGVLYTIRLNSRYDAAAGTVSVSPDAAVKSRYTDSLNTSDAYWYGMESSAVVVDRYLYVSENGGLFFCVDLDSMSLVWAQDTGDDSNSTPVYEPDGPGHGYLYTAPSLHWKADSDNRGSISVYKLDAITGEIVWTHSFDCFTVDGVSGGVQSTPVLGRTGSAIDGLVIYGVSRTPTEGSGVLTALDTETGDTVWSLSLDYYAWSSPLALYDAGGGAKLVLCDSQGGVYLIDGATGQVLDTMTLNGGVESTPAAFNDRLVVGTRGEQIYGMRVY